MRRPVVVLAALAAALLLAAAALADPNDPKVKLTKVGKAHAKAAVLLPSDLGPAWKGGLEKATSFKIPTCPAYAPNDSDLTLIGHSEAVSTLSSSGLQVDSDVEVFKTARQVEILFKRILQRKLATCLRYDLLKSVGGTNVTIGSVTRRKVPKVGSHAALFRVALKVKSSGQLVRVVSDFMFIAKGRTALFTNVVAPGSLVGQLTAFENRLARALAARAKA